MLFDIGGGSSEIAVIRIGENRSSRLANHITHWTSLPVGVVTLSERHGGEHVTPQSFEVMVREVEAMLAGFESPSVDALASGSYGDGFHLIGTSGTVTTLAGVHLDLPRYDRRRVDGLWLSDDEVSAMQARLLSWDFAARAANPCIGRTGPIWCLPAARFSRRSAAAGRRAACASPIAGFAKGC